MKRFWFGHALRFVVFATLAVGVFGYVVMLLWNWLVPSITGWQAVGFGQAVGLLVLCRILFGGLRGHGHWRHRMHARWEQMTPEERERFRAGFGRHCHSPSSEQRAA